MSTQDEWSSFKLVDKHVTSIAPEATFDAKSEEIKEDILRLIVQYLQNEGYTSASATILDEANVKIMEKHQEREMVRKISKSIKEGDWDLVAKMIHKNSNLRKVKFHSQQGLGFLYAVCKEEYLELIDRQEYQKAFTYLTTHLKPMEKVSGRQEFKDLCYLLTCKSITEVESFRDWEGVVKSREKLAEQLKATFELDAVPTENVNIPDNRLVNLLHQSVAYQMEFSRYHPKTVPKVSTLLRDFECQVLPNAVKTTFVGHSQNVKWIDNDNGDVCDSYPPTLVVPASLSQSSIESAAGFRAKGRLPVVTWLHPVHKSILARSSQPLLGRLLSGASCNMDEGIVNCYRQRPGPSKPFYIFDARKSKAAAGNRLMGKGGVETSENYEGAIIYHLNIANMYKMQASYQEK
ncbi:hypothetical protein DYB26_006557 [Aphanomyces astaci]|uniref:Myotubularin phosphatase domain-containing protein n=1 Tax=Aphanomyces astaci TaxID=112090 RepID=A0A3R7B965_APHAT|nr:hypothetical protein DYB26_006557 [Aphanomyces astaci]